MAEALTQGQIDELLQRMRSGEAEVVEETSTQKVKEYDFSSPKKFTKDQLKSLHNLHENYGRILAAYFTSILRNVCEIDISQIEEQRYFEFNNALPDNTLIAMITFRPEGPQYEESTLMLQLPTAFGFLLIDRLMGGTDAVYAPDRSYTEIELALLNSVLKNCAMYLKEAWSTFFELNVTLRSIETNGRLLQAFSPQDIVVVTTFDLQEDGFRGLANICVPVANLESIVSSFGVKYSHASKQQDPEKEQMKKDLVLNYLKESDLEIEAILDVCQMGLSDIAHLQKNDVIALNQKISDDIIVNIEGIPWLTARVGEVGQKKALKVVEILGK